MSISSHKKLKKLIFALFLIGVFCFSFADFSYAKTKEEWLSEINQLLIGTDSGAVDVVKDKQKWLSELEQVAKEETERKIAEIECLKNPETCPVPLEPLLIDENGNIKGAQEPDLHSEETSLFENLTQKIKQVLASLGLAIENGIAKVKELIADWGRFKNLEVENKIQLRDQATGEIYCTWIENGEWKKVKGECSAISGDGVDNNCNGQIDEGCSHDDSTPNVGETCSSSTLQYCTTSNACSRAGGYWYNNVCNAEPQAICDAEHLDLCDNETDCVNAGGYWYNEKCNLECQKQIFYLDSDGDGLSNIFEDAIGTNNNSIDTDEDGYNDKQELTTNYNPNGNGELNYDFNFSNKLRNVIKAIS